ncbi:MAG: exo-beta-N-acetylmuramidase NamZ domain-containing protein [Candidatus Tectimicrobiota bacterium]
MQLGLERLLSDAGLRAPLRGKRLALLAHPASVTHALTHALDALMALDDLNVVAAFGPQHGLRGDKQDNMIESDDYIDPRHQIPVFSLYGAVRRPTPAMMQTFDVLLADLQDIGCRIYTFITTLLYMLEASATYGKTVWVLDRPNPIGRPVEGLRLQPGWESFVGASPLPMRYGLTVGELARWLVQHFQLQVELQVVPMLAYDPTTAPGHGWPVGELSWVNPSPNAPQLGMARCFPGTVMVEGTHLSEGRGTTRPLELVGAPDLAIPPLLHTMQRLAPGWLQGCILRPCAFAPTFHKHVGQLCQGIQIHVDTPAYQHGTFTPFRLLALVFKALKTLAPGYTLWRDFPYEYETDRLAIDLISGGPLLRTWVDDPGATPADLEALLVADEQAWRQECQAFFLYPA